MAPNKKSYRGKVGKTLNKKSKKKFDNAWKKHNKIDFRADAGKGFENLDKDPMFNPKTWSDVQIWQDTFELTLNECVDAIIEYHDNHKIINKKQLLHKFNKKSFLACIAIERQMRKIEKIGIKPTVAAACRNLERKIGTYGKRKVGQLTRILGVKKSLDALTQMYYNNVTVDPKKFAQLKIIFKIKK